MSARGFNELPPDPPLPFRRTSPQILEVRERSGCLAVLAGVPFLLAGIFSTLILTGVVQHDSAIHRGWDVWVLPIMSFVFLGLGIVLVFGRRWLTLDLGGGSVIRQQGLLFPMRRQAQRLSEFTAVVIAYDRGDSDSPDRYPVRFRSLGAADFVVNTPLQFGEARAQAEYLSRALGLPLVDSTSDHESVVSAPPARNFVGHLSGNI